MPRWMVVSGQILWRISLFVVAFGMISALFLVPFDSLLLRWRETAPMQAQLYGDLAVAVGLLAATWLMLRFVDHRPFLSIGLAPESAVRDLAAGLALGATWLAASVGLAWAAAWATPHAPVGFAGSTVLVAALSMLLNVLGQQLLLCGYIFQTIRSRAGLAAALLVSSGLFSAIHAGAFGGAWLPAVNVFAAGLLFCLAYQASGNLWLPLGIHFAWNLLLGPVFGLTISGTGETGLGWSAFTIDGPALFTGGGFGLEGGLVVTLTTTLLAAWFGGLVPKGNAQ